jgi:hypothetical protein
MASSPARPAALPARYGRLPYEAVHAHAIRAMFQQAEARRTRHRSRAPDRVYDAGRLKAVGRGGGI